MRDRPFAPSTSCAPRVGCSRVSLMRMVVRSGLVTAPGRLPWISTWRTTGSSASPTDSTSPGAQTLFISKDINARVKCDALGIPCEDFEADRRYRLALRGIPEDRGSRCAHRRALRGTQLLLTRVMEHLAPRRELDPSTPSLDVFRISTWSWRTRPTRVTAALRGCLPIPGT